MIDLILHLFFFITVLSNLFAPRMRRRVLNTFPKVSLLIPARNEQLRIGKTLSSLDSLTYPNLEILILDDNSTDQTADMINKSRATLVRGKPLPKNWVGKNWALHQLAQKAKGKFLLFTDADIVIKNEAIESLVYEIQSADLLTCFPKNKMQGLGQNFMGHVFFWFSLNFLSFRLSEKIHLPFYTGAIGQCMLFKKKSYAKCGGFKSIKHNIVEDLHIARFMQTKNMTVKLCLANDNLMGKQFDSFIDGYQSFSKNFYASFGNIFFMFLALFIIPWLYVFPFIGIFYDSLYYGLIVLLILSSRMFIALMTSQSVFYHIVLHPFQIIVWMFVLVRSFILTKTGKRPWKGRLF